LVVGRGTPYYAGRKKGKLAMKTFIALVIGIAMMAPGVALADSSPTCASYSPQLCDATSNAGQRSSAVAANSTAQSTLPFTGLDVAFLVAGGGVLLAGGLVVRRLSREPS